MGCIPATVGVVNGEIVVGMIEQEIELVGREDGVLKLSTRDIPLCSQGFIRSNYGFSNLFYCT